MTKNVCCGATGITVALVSLCAGCAAQVSSTDESGANERTGAVTAALGGQRVSLKASHTNFTIIDTGVEPFTTVTLNESVTFSGSWKGESSPVNYLWIGIDVTRQPAPNLYPEWVQNWGGLWGNRATGGNYTTTVSKSSPGELPSAIATSVFDNYFGEPDAGAPVDIVCHAMLIKSNTKKATFNVISFVSAYTGFSDLPSTGTQGRP